MEKRRATLEYSINGRQRNSRIAASLLAVILVAGTALGQPRPLKLSVVKAYDYRLPVPSDSDVTEIFSEASRILARQFGVEPFWEFVDGGTKSLPEIFVNGYQTPKFKEWAARCQYPAEGTPNFLREKTNIVAFLSKWSLTELNELLPEGQTVRTYNDAFDVVTAAYARNIEELKQLRLKSGEFVIQRPPPPFQSLLHWRAMMNAQKDHDVFLTNSLVFADIFVYPYPHSIMKDTKISGTSSASPQRANSLGQTTMVSVLEEYSDIPGFHEEVRSLPRSKKNGIVAFTLAHELGHAIFYVPDIYDHGNQCLMNSSYEKASHLARFEELSGTTSPCPKCRPYVKFRMLAMEGEAALEAKDYPAAASNFLLAVDAMPDRLPESINREGRIDRFYEGALTAYEEAGDAAGASRVRDLWKQRHPTREPSSR